MRGRTILAMVLMAVTMTEGRAASLDDYFENETRAFSENEQKALRLARKFQADGGKSVSLGPNGAVVFVHGSGQPTVVCAVLQVCDIALQAGEAVNDVKAGDTVRWVIEPAFSGEGDQQTTHVTIKPTEPGLDTTILVLTTRRQYSIRLKSDKNDMMPHVAFSYPEDAAARWQAAKRRTERERTANTIPDTGEYLGDLDFGYRLTGDASWKPVRVFNDGRKTIIQMPETMKQTEAPVLLVLRREGDLFSDEETSLINYRMVGDRFIVDGVFDRGILIAGAGNGQDRVTIERWAKK